MLASAKTLLHAPPAPNVRRATAGDLDGLVALEQATFVLDRMSERQWRRHLDSLSAEVLVAARERQLVGAAIVFYRRGQDVARLYSIAVAASERGTGVGADAAGRRGAGGAPSGSRRLRLEVRVRQCGRAAPVRARGVPRVR